MIQPELADVGEAVDHPLAVGATIIGIEIRGVDPAPDRRGDGVAGLGVVLAIVMPHAIDGLVQGHPTPLHPVGAPADGIGMVDLLLPVGDCPSHLTSIQIRRDIGEDRLVELECLRVSLSSLGDLREVS
jgi:hypothetical protein